MLAPLRPGPALAGDTLEAVDVTCQGLQVLRDWQSGTLPEVLRLTQRNRPLQMDSWPVAALCTGEAGRGLLSSVFYCCILTCFLFIA